ncbi:glutamate--tRNA ligase family protein [Mucilaginibacter sp. OK098]|uniref:glutamate--tRNA ligase family protein n=1 Tax=Mucilaginibacter sp. OK098 TaxID=1855297 RepID=UPI0009242CFF|nr:glutamate--tRNA ligase family protein [Mucilaginibacter sp. OK098]SHM79127.1 glutamyl-tRNA synthetase [Mucilaginibacter sp. OK098]
MPHLSSRFNKTRIAPTPSGYLHVGNVLSFAVTALLARKSGAKTLLRIDDLDQPRVNKLYLQDIFDTLNFLEIPWDEGPRNLQEFEAGYSQLHRMPLYMQALNQLADERLVFACSCSRSRLDAGDECLCFDKQIALSSENTSWRLLTTNNNDIQVKGYSGNIIKTTLPEGMHNFVVRKKDGFPAYQLTSVIDDLFFGVDLVVRGEDLWPSTLAQHLLANVLGENNFADVTFYHHPLLMEAGKKISKSSGAVSIRYLRESGKKPTDIYIMIAGMLGIKDPINNWEELAGRVIMEVKL